MTDILVAGSVGVDHIWRLDRRLQTGLRLHCLDRTLRVGGGAANTGAALAELGHAPLIAARIAEDALGEALMTILRDSGMDTGAIERVPGPTAAGTILLDPDGERTLIAGSRKHYTLPRGVTDSAARVTYINLARLVEPAVLATLHDRPWVVAQLPLDLGEIRPAHALIASRSDIGDMPAAALWDQRRRMDGVMLRFVVVTNGRHGVELVDASGVRALTCAAPVAADSIGAGDFFAAGLIDALAGGASADTALHHGQSAAARFIASRPPMLRVLEVG